MIQSCGMAASSFTIIYMRVKVEWHSIIYSSLGAFVSIILGLQFWDDLLTGEYKRCFIVISFRLVEKDDFCLYLVFVRCGSSYFKPSS